MMLNRFRGNTPKWVRIIAGIAAGFSILSTLAVLAIYFALEHDQGFRQRILAMVESSVAESSGAKLQVRDFHFRAFSLDLYGIIVRGSESNPDEPLLQADHINVGVKILSYLHGTWRLQDIVIDHPVAHIFVNQAGENNLPQSKSKSSGNTSIFDLAIQKAVLNRGEIYYNDKKSLLDAELEDVNLNAGFDNAQSRYHGDLGYHNGRIHYGTYNPLVHDLQARFQFTRDQFVLDQLDLATGASHLVLKATVHDFSANPRVEASYDAALAGDDFKRLLKNPEIPGGAVRLTGSIAYQSDPNRPALETVRLDGQVSSRELNIRTPDLRAQIRDLDAHYKLEDGNAEVENLHAQLLGGRIDGKLAIRDLSGASQARLQASVRNLSLKDIAVASGNQASLQQAQIAGTISADAQATWAKTLDNLIAHVDATTQGAMGKDSSASTLNGVIHAGYRGAGQQITLTQSYIKTPQTSITLNGTVSRHSQLQVRLQSNNLHELEVLAANFSKPAAGQPQEMGLYGAALLTATVTGSTRDPQITGQLAANNLQVKGSSWKVLRAGLSADPSSVRITNGDLESATRGRINFDVQTDLKQWKYTPSSPVAIHLSAEQLSLAELERLAGQTYPVAGTLAVNVSVHGSQSNPVGNGQISLLNAKVADEPIQSASIQFRGDGNALNADLQIHLPAGTTEAKATYYPKSESFQAQAQISNLRLEKLQAVRARNMQINGGLSLDASGHGTLKSPELTASLRIPQLQVEKQTIRGLVFNTSLHGRTAEISLNSEAAQTYVKASGSLGIDAPYPSDLRVDTGQIPFQPLLAIYAPAQAQDMGGQTELHASIHGPLQDPSKVEAHLEIPVLAANYKDIKLAATKPIHLDYQNGVATLQPASIQGTGTDLQMQGRAPVANLRAASFKVLGTIDLQLAQMFSPDLKSSGQIQFDVNLQQPGNSNVQGQIRLVNGNIQTPDAPVGLSNANGVITVSRDRIEIGSFQGEVGGGTITAKGGVVYQPQMQFSLALSGNNVRLRYPQGVRAVLGSDLALTGNPQAATLSGQVRVEHVSFTNDFDLSTFLGQFTGESAPPSTPGLAQNIKLNVALQSTSDMNLSSSQVSLQGSANLRIVGTAADPVILGRTNLTGGDIFLANNRYVIQSGNIDFVNPVTTEPVVNVQVSTIVNDYNISLHFQGPVERLQTSYTSEPPLPQVDIINLLAFGQTTEAQAANPSPSGVAGGEALLAQGVTSQASSKIAKLAGISSLSIDPSLGAGGTNQSNPGARVTIQQRVTGNLFVTFATDVTSTQDQQIQVQYNLTPKWSLNALRDQNGGFGVDAKYRKSF